MFSLVIPTFNRADLIGETIDTALSQSVPFTEIIVVDDGSTDHTTQALARFGGRIRVIRTQNQGVQAARNVGVAAAQQEYVTLCDSDDLLEPSFLETLSSWLALHRDIDLVYVNFQTFNDSAVSVDKFSQTPPGWFDGAQREALSGNEFCWAIPELYKRTIVFQPLFPTGQSFRKSFYQSIGGYDPRFNGLGSEDLEFTLRAIAAGQVALCMQPLTKIRKHSGNDSGNLIRQLLGEASILHYALDHHGIDATLAAVMKASIEKRRLEAFDHAYATGNFIAVGEVLETLKTLPASNRSLKFLLKKVIASLPSGIRGPLWAVMQ